MRKQPSQPPNRWRTSTRRYKGVLKRYETWAPDALIVLRGDSGFAVPGLFQLAETKGHKYAIRLKANARLQSTAQSMADQVFNPNNLHERQVHYREFLYKAGSWDRARRVVVKMERPAGELLPVYIHCDKHEVESEKRDSVLFSAWAHGEFYQGSKEWFCL